MLFANKNEKKYNNACCQFQWLKQTPLPKWVYYIYIYLVKQVYWIKQNNKVVFLIFVSHAKQLHKWISNNTGLEYRSTLLFTAGGGFTHQFFIQVPPSLLLTSNVRGIERSSGTLITNEYK